MELCRYVSFERFCEMIFNKELTLISPDMWNDQYENYILRLISSDDGLNQFKDLLQSKSGTPEDRVDEFVNFIRTVCTVTRCLCFSKSLDEEVMWNAYSYENHAIMWTTTDDRIEKLNDGLSIRIVKYDLEEIGIANLMKHFRFVDTPTIVDDDKLLAHKRKFFAYENEVRVINTDIYNRSSTKAYSIPELKDFITGVLVHPKAADSFVKMVGNLCGILDIPFLGRSKIYDFSEIY